MLYDGYKINNSKSISANYKLCKDCIYNESADDKDYSAKLICGKHGKIVDVRDEACSNFIIGSDNSE